MNAAKRLIQTEPAVLVGVFVAVCSLVGITLSADDVTALTQVLTVVLPLVGAIVVRQSVTPTTTPATAGPEALAEHGANPELIDDGDPR